MNKRLLNLFLALVMIVCVLPFAASAASVDGCDHDYDLFWTMRNATCVEDGYGWYVCTLCGAREGRAIPAGHSVVTIPGKEATCTEAGKTEGERCSVCTRVLKAQETIPAGHDFSIEAEIIKDPTCTSKGIVRYQCSRCDATQKKNVDALGHKSVVIPATEPTCTMSIRTAGEKCERCDAVLVKPELVSGTLLGHEYKSKVTKKATCTEDGVKTFTCIRGDHSYTEVIPALGHDHSVNKGYKEGKEPTCKKTGLYLIGCSRCDDLTTQTAPKVDHKPKVNPGVAATCETAGWTDGSVCEYCDLPLVFREAIPALKHDYTVDKGITKAPTCKDKGTRILGCSRCGHETVQEVATVDCEYEVIPGYAATCTKEGRTDGEKCKFCGTVTKSQKVIAALGHDHTVDKGITKAPTCTEKGTRILGCSRCGHETVQNVATVDCEYEVIPGYAATCTKEGRTDGEKCKFCGTVTKSQRKIAVQEHQYTEFVKVVTPATCTGKLVERYKCATCDATKQVWGDALGHTPVDIAEIPATCTEPGVSAAKQCSVCDEILEGRDEIKPLGHDYTVDLGYREGDEPHCHVDGATGIRVVGCSRCDAKTAQTAPTVDCVAEVWKGRAPTCTETGRTDGEKCKFCGKTMKDREVIPALDHDFSIEFRVVKAPTCTKAGSTVFKCSRCEGYCELPVEALGHSLVELERWDATCTKDGITETKCDRCKLQTISRVEALGHTEEVMPAVEATCTATGLTEGKKCATCGLILKAQEEVAMKDHAWAEKEGLAATCKNDGYTAYEECADCGATKGKEVVAAAHKYENFKCTVCGAGDPLCEHEDAVITHTASTCTTRGVDVFYCEACGYEFQEELPLAGHEIEIQNTPATCTAKGVTKKVCTVCQQVLESIDIPMIAHDYAHGKCRVCEAADPNYTAPSTPTNPSNPSNPGTSGCQHINTSTFTNPATCTTAGYKLVTCTDCQAVVERVILKALGHTNNVELQPETCTKNGVKIVTCDRCDKYDYEVLPATGRHNYVDGICTSCRGADPNRYTRDYQDVFILQDEEAAG